MKVSRLQAEQNRDRIIEVAGELFRERGFDGIGIAGLMKAAGLTHGGFYGNFRSKEDLAAQACERAFEMSGKRLRALSGDPAESSFSGIVQAYLSKEHRDAPGVGCPLTALSPDAARLGGAVRSVFTAGIRSYLQALSKMLPGRSAKARRAKALSVLSQMVGALVLARATDDAALSDELLEATRSSLLSPR